MSRPFYAHSARQASALDPRSLTQANVGLWFTRFYDGFDPTRNWEISKDSKKSFIDDTVALTERQTGVARERVQGFARRQKTLCEALGGQCVTLTADAPMLTGSGLSHPVENGFTFHPTLGLPFLPAAGVKGLLRGWIEVWAGLEEAARQERVGQWFGRVDGRDGQVHDESGLLIFFDAVPADLPRLGCDILTPHMGKWYEKGDTLTAAELASAGPGDWHSPVPSPFLVVEPGARFQFGIAPRCTGEVGHDAKARIAAAEALAALQQALEWIGAGAKTAAGYGRLVDREARQRQAVAEQMAAAGIQTGHTEWPQAEATWNKGKVELRVSHQGRACVLTQQPAREMRSKLSAADLSRLDKGKPVKVQARVEIQGNNCRLIDVASLAG